MPVFSRQALEITGCFPPCGGIIFLGKQEGAFEQVLLETVVNQVVHNCNISDARYAGYYSVCGLALRLRDLYKWEKGLDPWVEDEPSKVLEWIGEREDLFVHSDDKEVDVLCPIPVGVKFRDLRPERGNVYHHVVSGPRRSRVARLR